MIFVFFFQLKEDKKMRKKKGKKRGRNIWSISQNYKLEILLWSLPKKKKNAKLVIKKKKLFFFPAINIFFLLLLLLLFSLFFVIFLFFLNWSNMYKNISYVLTRKSTYSRRPIKSTLFHRAAAFDSCNHSRLRQTIIDSHLMQDCIPGYLSWK